MLLLAPAWRELNAVHVHCLTQSSCVELACNDNLPQIFQLKHFATQTKEGAIKDRALKRIMTPVFIVNFWAIQSVARGQTTSPSNA